MVEPQIVVLVVAGSSPVGHPASQIPIPNSKLQIRDSTFGIWNLGFGNLRFVPVAQPDRASDFGSEGWGFESLQARSYENRCFSRSGLDINCLYVAFILASPWVENRAKIVFDCGTADYPISMRSMTPGSEELKHTIFKLVPRRLVERSDSLQLFYRHWRGSGSGIEGWFKLEFGAAIDPVVAIGHTGGAGGRGRSGVKCPDYLLETKAGPKPQSN